MIEVKHVGRCPHGWPAFRGVGELVKGYYYIRQPNMEGGISWFRCSKDWEPDYECRPKIFKIINNYDEKLYF